MTRPREFEPWELQLWHVLCTTDPPCNKVKKMICVKCEYLGGRKNPAVQNRYCDYGAKEGTPRMCSAFTCIDRGYFKPKSPKTNPKKIQEEINEYISGRLGNTPLGEMWKEYRDRADDGGGASELSAPAYDSWEDSDIEEGLQEV